MKLKTFLVLFIFIFISAQGVGALDAKSLYNQADRFYLQGDYKATLKYCRCLLTDFKKDPLRDEAALLAGLALLKLRLYDEARDYFNAVINQRPESPLKEDAYLGLADSYFLEKDYKRAGELYNEILINFSDTDFRGIIEERLNKTGKTEGARPQAPSLYTVQIGSFNDKKNAATLYRRFKKRGYSAYICESDERGRILYKVRIGKFKSEEEARELANSLKKEGYETNLCAW